MKTISATVAKRNFSKLLKDVQVDPVVIQRYGKNHSVALSTDAYEQLAKKSPGIK